jgi:beta-ribofuranosylaminobenzene 5'-phosphate synthase
MLDIKILLLVPEEKWLSGKEEIEFFLKTCPINENVVEKLARIINSQILPALCERDINIFCQAINSIWDLDWKKNEICRYSKAIQNFIKNLQKIGYWVGLSSTWPCIYILGSNLKGAIHEINNTDIKFRIKIITKPNNYWIKRRKKLWYLY